MAERLLAGHWARGFSGATPVHLHGCVVINTVSGSVGAGVRCATHEVNVSLILFSAIAFLQATNGECK